MENTDVVSGLHNFLSKPSAKDFIKSIKRLSLSLSLSRFSSSLFVYFRFIYSLVMITCVQDKISC